MHNENETVGTMSTTAGRFLCFSLGSDRYAIPLLEVKEVIGNVNITPIPKTPAYFKGILNLRGQVISVIDLRTKLQSKASKASDKQESIIILDFNSLLVSVMVDSVDSVATFDESALSPTPSGMSNKFVTGVAKGKDTLTLILDLKSALNSEDLAVIQKAAA